MMPLLFWPTLNSFKMYYQNDLDSSYHFFLIVIQRQYKQTLSKKPSVYDNAS